MKFEEYLGVWQLKSNGESIPIDYEELCCKIEKLAPGTVGFRIVRQLEEERFISTCPNGMRILSAEGKQKRIPLPLQPLPQKLSSEKHWERFRHLCAYYADCVSQSEKSQEYLFATDLNNKYLCPTLPIGWLDGTGKIPIRYSRQQKPAVNRILSCMEDTEDVYLGYPLSAFRCANGKTAYTPVLLFPVDISYSTNVLEIQIRRDEIDINRTWMEFNVPREEHSDVLNSLCFSAGEKNGLLNAEVAIQYLANRLKTELIPDFLDYRLDHKVPAVINHAAMFVGNSLRYSKSLKRELKLIAKQPAHVLDQTALAYVFRDPPLENRYETPPRLLPLEFLPAPSNTEQHAALKTALNTPVSKIQGPPGTGKSQVAVNLVANLVANGQSALFTSKNHKAIHAIYERASEASPELPLLQFCSLPSGEPGTEWRKMRVEDQIASCNDIWRQKQFLDDPSFMRDFVDVLGNWRDSEELVTEIDNTRALRQTLAAQEELLLKNIPEILLPNLSPSFVARLETLLLRLRYSDQKKSWLQKLLDWFFLRNIKSVNVEYELREMLPFLAKTCYSTKTLQERVLRLCSDINNYLAVKQKEREVEARRTRFEDGRETGLAEGFAMLREKAKDILLFSWLKTIKDIAGSEITMTKMKDASARIAGNSVLPFFVNIDGIHDYAQAAFSPFLKIYPAWATTLLSLSKSSPCIAGLFNRIIIDEAAQCEIPPIIPALYRSKDITVIGDPKQFPPVITLRSMRHHYLRFQKHDLAEIPENLDFMQGNAFDVINARTELLREHFRCAEEISDYFNSEYYGGKLKNRTDVKRLNFPTNLGFRHAVTWQNVDNSVSGEVTATKVLLNDLIKNNYNGSIGVISPFREIAETLRQELHGNPLLDLAQDVNTANGFQGGERDLVILVLGLTANMSRGKRWYAEAPENQYIYNVAVSRARACLLIIGDREQARHSSSSALRRLANIETQRKPKVLSQSPGEEILYQALCKAGLQPVQQYPLAGRYLDIALVEQKIDIEVDGEAWHLNQYGERKTDDVFRDLQIQSHGWRVIRFWYREIRDDLSDCIASVQAIAINKQF